MLPSSSPDPTPSMSFIAGLLVLMSIFSLFSPNSSVEKTQNPDLELKSSTQSFVYTDLVEQQP